MTKIMGAFAISLLFLAKSVWAENSHSHHQSDYVGQVNREIKSLSDNDIAELRRGGGWGMAKAAELNGVPGPAHLLELKDQIPLSKDQVAQIQALFDDMKANAIILGEKLIAAERTLEEHFRTGSANNRVLRASLSRIAEIRQELRYIHLATHLKTPEILSEDQIVKYNALRGYNIHDPCSQVPEGHDAAMWRKHNGCE